MRTRRLFNHIFPHRRINSGGCTTSRTISKTRVHHHLALSLCVRIVSLKPLAPSCVCVCHYTIPHRQIHHDLPLRIHVYLCQCCTVRRNKRKHFVIIASSTKNSILQESSSPAPSSSPLSPPPVSSTSIDSVIQ